MLEVANLNVWYGVTEVLRDVSFEVPQGALVALLGGNGSGKTTIINTLSGMVTPRKGTVRFLGTEMAGRPSDAMVKAGIVQVPQGREVFANMSVRDNLDLGAATRTDRKGIRDDLEEMYGLFPRLRDKQTHKAGSLSGGEQQQVAVARALMSRPKLLLLDEPSVGLSPVLVDALIETIRLLHGRGLTMLLVEQNVGVAAAVAGQAYVLKDGEIAYRGPAPELIGNPEVLASYLGR
ncbi:branched-chain amino acid transport system ATP-binding protein [Constrictibacter sp. MBR-5]|jgi:branched-chain amino acid transport system ATP-binding protein|uniref:ABC transporter ATP-binding protein n=1 Tax=Constrictibacter sp. MBR-5 TaxID=3156467 RepID=UPI003390AC9C